MTSRRAALGGLVVVSFAAASALRWTQSQPGLLYPDGYQYLLMARGLLEEGRPVLPLGDGSETLLPNVDASLKPLFPALVAAMQLAGSSPLTSARVVTALAAGAVILLAGVLALRLTGSRLAGASAAALVAASPTLAFWTGFSGPDALGQALALGSALALVGRRPGLGGSLAGLAVLARPELLLVAGGALIAGLLSARARSASVRGATVGILTLALALAALRPPLAVPGAEALAGLAVVPLAVLAWRVASSRTLAAAAGVAACAVVAYAAAEVGDWSALAAWSRREWALAAVAGAGALVGALHPSYRRATTALVAAAAVLGAAYWAKNPHVERYVALILPLLALAAALGVAASRRVLVDSVPAAAVGPVAVLVAVTAILLAPAPEPVARDTFAGVADAFAAARLPAEQLVTAAPDAYGFLLRDRTVVPVRPGARGLIVLDGAQRLYVPGLRVDGTEVARFDPGDGFLRPDGRVDTRPVVVVSGRVTSVGG